MKTKHFLILLISSVLLLNGCKEIEPDEPLTLADFLDNNKPALQTFTVQAGTTSSINGAKGCTVSFRTNSFFSLSGTPVTSGDIEIQLREVTNKKDMVLSQTPTVSDNKLIVSRGVYFLKALQNGFELRIDSVVIANKYPETQSPSLKTFLGGTVSGQSFFNWFIDTTSNWLPSVWYDNANDTTYYNMQVLSTNFTSQNFNWINCDYFYNNSVPKVNISFTSTEDISVYYFQSYLVFSDLNAVLRMTSYSNNTIAFNNIPTGLDATLVTYYIVDGKPFVATAQITVSDGLSTPITFSETTEQGLLDILENL